MLEQDCTMSCYGNIEAKNRGYYRVVFWSHHCSAKYGFKLPSNVIL
jgi:hypothetical protein